jgi:hypothetical protein
MEFALFACKSARQRRDIHRVAEIPLIHLPLVVKLKDVTGLLP